MINSYLHHQCSSGFIVPNPKALTVICPDCRNAFCRQCKKQWKNQHLNLSCEQFTRWEKEHDIDYAEQLLNKHLEEFGIGLLHFTLFVLLIIISFLPIIIHLECPNCHFRYQLAKGGCMHFRCTQCSFDFCGGCYRPFKLGSVSEILFPVFLKIKNSFSSNVFIEMFSC